MQAPDVVSQYLLYELVSSIYSIYFHPLSKFPGSKTAAASSLPYLRAQLRGRLPQWIKEQHDRFASDVVRVRPDGLSFIGGAAWKDMFTHRYGSQKFKKDSIVYGRAANGVDSVLTANDADHTRMRALMAHAFSEKALESQEPLIQSYVSLLIDGLKTQVDRTASGKVDMVQWLSWVTFDIVGDLSMGKAFHSLTDRGTHEWVSFLSETFKALVFMSGARQLKVPEFLLPLVLPRGLYQKRMDHLRSVSDNVDQRLKERPERPDFLSYILKHNDEKGMSLPELKANASLLLGAGSFSTATVLCGAVYYLCRNPSVLEKVTEEVRGTFRSGAEISVDRTMKLEYLSAVLNESHRMYPAALAGSPHRTPSDGAVIDGHWIPGDVSPSCFIS